MVLRYLIRQVEEKWLCTLFTLNNPHLIMVKFEFETYLDAHRLPVEQVCRVISPRPEINIVIPPEVVALVPDVAEVVLGASVVAGEGVETSVGGQVGRLIGK